LRKRRWILSMPTSRPYPKLVVCCLIIAGTIYGVSSAALTQIASWAEAEFETYPYLAGEDPLRLLLPTVHGGTDRGSLLLGPSAIGEAFLYEVLEKEWGARVRSGSLSNGTLDDCYLFLSYIEKVYGPQAMPGRVILGIKPRVIANLPRLFGPKADPSATRFLVDLIDRYSLQYKAEQRELGTELVPKTAPEKVKSALRFYLTKQQPRHRAGVLAVIEHAIDPDPLKVGFQRQLPDYADNLRMPLTRYNVQTTLSYVLHVGPWDAAMGWIRAYRSAYTNMFMEQLGDERIRRIVANAEMGFHWDPREEQAMVDMQLRRFADLVERNDI